MNSFWSLSTIDKCTVLARLVQALSKANLTSLQMLAAARGETVEEIWRRCCCEAGVEPCAMPQHLFEGADEAARRDQPEPVSSLHDTPGFAARAKILAELQRAKPFQTRHLQAHAGRP